MSIVFFPNNMHQMTTTSEVSFCYFLFMVPYFLVRLVIFNWALFGAPDHLFVGFPDGLRWRQLPPVRVCYYVAWGLREPSPVSDGTQPYSWLEVFVDSSVIWIWAVIPCMVNLWKKLLYQVFYSYPLFFLSQGKHYCNLLQALPNLLLVQSCPSLTWRGFPIGLFTFGFQNESLILQLGLVICRTVLGQKQQKAFRLPLCLLDFSYIFIWFLQSCQLSDALMKF